MDTDLFLITIRNGDRIILDRANTAVMILTKPRRGRPSLAAPKTPIWQAIAHIDPIRIGADLRIAVRPHGTKAPSAVYRGRDVTTMRPLTTLELRELGIARISWQRTR